MNLTIPLTEVLLQESMNREGECAVCGWKYWVPNYIGQSVCYRCPARGLCSELDAAIMTADEQRDFIVSAYKSNAWPALVRAVNKVDRGEL